MGGARRAAVGGKPFMPRKSLDRPGTPHALPRGRTKQAKRRAALLPRFPPARAGRQGEAAPGAAPLSLGASSPPSGGSIGGRGAAPAGRGGTPQGCPVQGTPAAPRVAHRPGFSSGLFCWFFSCFFLFFCARARGLPAKPYAARVSGVFGIPRTVPFFRLAVPFFR